MGGGGIRLRYEKNRWFDKPTSLYSLPVFAFVVRKTSSPVLSLHSDGNRLVNEVTDGMMAIGENSDPDQWHTFLFAGGCFAAVTWDSFYEAVARIYKITHIYICIYETSSSETLFHEN